MLLEGFPLADEVAHLPHQGLMAVDEFAGRLAVVVEAGRGHRRLQFLDARLTLGDAGLEVRDPLLKRFGRPLLFLALGLDALAVVAAGFGRLRDFGLRATGCGRLWGFGLRATGCGRLGG